MKRISSLTSSGRSTDGVASLEPRKQNTFLLVLFNASASQGQSRIAAKKVEMMYKEPKYSVTSILANTMNLRFHPPIAKTLRYSTSL
jgi:hypothetical protein